MRRPAALALLGLALLATACSDDDPAPPDTTSASTTTTSPGDGDQASLDALLIDPGDLPGEFTASSAVDDTITAFCAGEDATAGLQATGRAARGLSRTGGGASVIQLVFRFRAGDAAAFVDQAGAILERCSGVPDATGLAFDYEPLQPSVEAPVAQATDAHVGRYGVNVGSGDLSIELVVLRSGDVGQLVAVLGLDTPRALLDDLATVAFTAAAERL